MSGETTTVFEQPKWTAETSGIIFFLVVLSVIAFLVVPHAGVVLSAIVLVVWLGMLYYLCLDVYVNLSGRKIMLEVIEVGGGKEESRLRMTFYHHEVTFAITPACRFGYLSRLTADGSTDNKPALFYVVKDGRAEPAQAELLRYVFGRELDLVAQKAFEGGFIASPELVYCP